MHSKFQNPRSFPSGKKYDPENNVHFETVLSGQWTVMGFDLTVINLVLVLDLAQILV